VKPAAGKTEPVKPPATNPPGTKPPGTNPPATNAPATNPPKTNPPATNPPATTPPATKPPAEKPFPGVSVPSGGPGPVGFDGEWPSSAFVPEELNISIVKEDDVAKVYKYRSTHFEFTSDVQLKPRLVSACAKVFEATHEFLRLLPLNHRTTADGTRLFPVTLFEEYDDYVKAGGLPGSAGVCKYSSRDDSLVLVPLESFGVKKVGKDYTVDSKDKDYSVLAHEITHMIMEYAVKQASWYIEGSAEYVANTGYTGGRFKIAVNKSYIVEAVTAYGKDGNGGQGLGTNLKMPRLERFMTQSYREFLSNSRFNYGMACLLTYYWYHQDGNGDAARIKEYLKALQAGIPEEDARQKLLDGRTWEQLETEFAKGMRRMGVRIDYAG
jgi:hypothetical protein